MPDITEGTVAAKVGKIPGLELVRSTSGHYFLIYFNGPRPKDEDSHIRADVYGAFDLAEADSYADDLAGRFTRREPPFHWA
jgi:hypothetical protein